MSIVKEVQEIQEYLQSRGVGSGAAQVLQQQADALAFRLGRVKLTHPEAKQVLEIVQRSVWSGEQKEKLALSVDQSLQVARSRRPNQFMNNFGAYLSTRQLDYTCETVCNERSHLLKTEPAQGMFEDLWSGR